MDVENVKALDGLVKKVVEVAEARSQAVEEETKAEVELLTLVVEKVKPALGVLCTRIVGSNADGAKLFLPRRGVCVDDDKPGPVRDDRSKTRGEYVGADLYLMEDATFERLTYEGRWSNWEGESSEWTVSTKVLSVLEVVETSNIDDVIERLARLLKSHAEGGGLTRAAKARERAKKISAIVDLLG